eukprot:scaffold298004_cov70-Cyclotella_meneghiniana.AAC.1
MTTSARHHRNNVSSGSFDTSLSPLRRSSSKHNNGSRVDSDDKKTQSSYNMNRVKFLVLLVLCLQNTLFTVMRRYSLGVLKESYSKYEVLLVAEVIKVVFSAFQIAGSLPKGERAIPKLKYILRRSSKMVEDSDYSNMFQHHSRSFLQFDKVEGFNFADAGGLIVF